MHRQMARGALIHLDVNHTNELAYIVAMKWVNFTVEVELLQESGFSCIVKAAACPSVKKKLCTNFHDFSLSIIPKVNVSHCYV